MTDEDRLGKLESELRNFRVVTSGSITDQVATKFDRPPKSNQSLSNSDRIASLEKTHQDFRIIGGKNVTVEGSLGTGYCITGTCPEPSTSGFPAPFPPIPPTPTGACCVGEVCSITTESNCTGMGGVYQGDSTTCTPNPCTGDTCLCGGFFNPDDGLFYNTKIYTNIIDNSHCPIDGTCLCFEGPNPDPEAYPCGSNRWMFEGDNLDSLLVSEHFNEACEIVQSFSNFGVGYYCCCFSSCDDPTTCTPYIPGTCPPCEGAPIPESWTKCGIITTTISYADPCNP